MTTVTKIERLQSALRGPLLQPGDNDYDTSRTVWNAMIDKHPQIIVRPTGAADVCTAVDYARQNNLLLSIRGGGHNVSGSGICSDGLSLDLSDMRWVHVDPAQKTARVAGGALLRDLDHEAQAFGLATPGGVVSSTGVAGLTLGGGFGWLARQFGLAADNLQSVDLVTADGRLVKASDQENPDLFWAVRGGGGNFGVVTEFLFRLHPLPNKILFGPALYEIADAPTVLENYSRLCPNLPRECTVWADLYTAPAVPHIPKRLHGKKVLSLLQCFIGEPVQGRKILASIVNAAVPVFNAVELIPYYRAQSFLDEMYAFGARNYWTTQSYATLSDTTIEAIVDLANEMPTDESDILIAQVGGAINDRLPDATAYPHRGLDFVVCPSARWRLPPDDERCIDWAKVAGARLVHSADGGKYVNFLAGDEEHRGNVFGENLPRLKRVKRMYDPDNLFRVNQNIRPE